MNDVLSFGRSSASCLRLPRRCHKRKRATLTALILGVLSFSNLTAQQTLPLECGKSGLGNLIVFPPRQGIAYGISTDTTTFPKGEPIRVNIWIDNRSETVFRSGLCDMFGDWGVAVWNDSGKRLLSTREQRHMEGVTVCDSNALIEVKPQSCEVVNYTDLALSFTLAPGRYRIAELPWPASDSASEHPYAPAPATGKSLIITIVP
jgi:hypothetical protein